MDHLIENQTREIRSGTVKVTDLYSSIFEQYINTIELFFPLLLLAMLPGFGTHGSLVGASIGLLALVVFSLPVKYFINSRTREFLLWLEPTLILLGGFLASLIIESATADSSKAEIQTLWHFFVLLILVGRMVFEISEHLGDLGGRSRSEDRNPSKRVNLLSGVLVSLVFFVAFMFSKSTESSLSLKMSAYVMVALILSFRLWNYSKHYGTYISRSAQSQKTLAGGQDSIRLNSSISFDRVFVVHLLRIIGMYFLFSEFLGQIKKMELGNVVVWLGAIQAIIAITLLRNLLRGKVSSLSLRKDAYSLYSALGPFVLLIGVIISGSHFLSNSSLIDAIVFGISTLVLLLMTDVLEKHDLSSSNPGESSMGNVSGFDTRFLAASFAQLLLGLVLSLIYIYYQQYSNVFMGSILSLVGVYLLVSNVFLRKGESGTTMKAFVRIQLVKIVMLLTMIVVGFDILSFALSMKDKRKTTIRSTIETVLIGLKPSFLQGDSVQANNFLFSLKKGRFIGCFKLDFGSLASNDCEINEAPIAKYESVEVPIEYDGNKYGRVELYFDFGFLKKDLYLRVILDVVLSLIFFFVLIRLFNVIAKRFFSEVEQMNEILASGKSNLLQKPEFAIFEFQRMAEEIHESMQLRDTVQYHSAMNKVANQVAHDIRSPLMALNVAIQLASGLDARSRDLIRNSANRIRDIANNLVQKSKTGSFEIVNSVVTVEMIGAIVEDLASEKRLEFRKLPELVLDTDISNSYGLFAKIAANDLKRVLSNLINNSNEALKNKWRISITVRRSEFISTRLCIDIVDNGPGFSDQILDTVGHQQISLGKKDHEHSGLGLGTFHAMQMVKSWGGEISFQNMYHSSQGVQSVPDVLGARVLIELPIAEAPQWFCPEIKVYNQSQVMIFDDDHTVQMMWKEKIRKLKFDGMTAPLHCVAFGYGRQLMENTFGNLSDIDTVFVDYEIAGDQKNGLDYIRELEIAKNSVLITSHYEDSKIQQSALDLGIKIIPKTMAHLVPFHFSQSLPNSGVEGIKEEKRIEPENLFDGVLIDDSSEIHLVWNVHRNGKKIKIYPYPKTFIEDCHSLDPRSPVFLDLHFGKHGEGLDFVKEIYNLGFKDITIVTSYAKAHVVIPPELRHMIKEVRGKIPPWAKSTGLEEYEF